MNIQYKYRIKWSSRFKKDYKLAIRRGYDISLLDDVIRLIAAGNQQQLLKEKYDDHELSGNWKNHRELHVLPDWLLIYYLEDDILVLNLSRTGTHSDLFSR